MKNQSRTKTQNRQTVSEQLWLTYFNDALYAKGIITEDQRNKMRVKIKNRSAAAGRKIWED